MAKQFPFNFDPESKLPEDGESLLWDAFNARKTYSPYNAVVGEYFLNQAISNLLDKCDDDTRYYPGRECRYHMLMAHINTKDEIGFRKLLNYWWNWKIAKYHNSIKVVNVSKFVPGEHFHVDGVKFNTLPEAKTYIAKKGFRYGGLIEKWIYLEE